MAMMVTVSYSIEFIKYILFKQIQIQNCFIQIVLEGVRGSGIKSDIAIDDVLITADIVEIRTTTVPTTTATTTTQVVSSTRGIVPAIA